LCDKEGHLAKRCWNFLKLKKKQSTNIAETFSVCTVQDFNNHEWFLDSGATSHITNNPDNLDVSTVYTNNERVLVGNGQSLPISHKGSVSNIIRLTCAYTPSQNGIAERKHRHVTETSLTLMFHARLPVSFWVEAFSTAVFLINRLPSLYLGGTTPYELLFGNKPDYSMLRTFRCICFL
jgi:hypothetical protein